MPAFYCRYIRTCHVPQIVEDGWQLTAHNAPSITGCPERPHDLSFALHSVASGRDPEIVAITEEWGDQPPWKTGGDLGMPISIFLSPQAQDALPPLITM